MTTNWLRDVQDWALNGRLRAIGGRKVLPVPIPAVIAQTIATSRIAEGARINSPSPDARDRIGVRRRRNAGGQKDYLGAYARRQPRCPRRA